jgi:prephenate dehydrogenase
VNAANVIAFEDSDGRFAPSSENGAMTLHSGGVAVVGTGLMGASVGLAAKRAGVERVAGFDSDPGALAVAVDLGAVDVAAESLEEAVDGAALVVVATPVGTIAARAAEALAATGHGCAVTDVGSTKASICAALAGEARFVGGHPMAGSEAQGPSGARAELFAGSTWFLASPPGTDPEPYRIVHDFVAALGAEPVPIDPVAHDKLVALTSHLPHALANVLWNQTVAADALDLVGRSFTDMTRVAGANPRMWTDIFLENATFIADALGEYRHRLEGLEVALRGDDGDAVSRWFEEAARDRPR